MITITNARRFCVKQEPESARFYHTCTGKNLWFNYFRIKRKIEAQGKV